MKKRGQHYVWRHYLDAWAVDEKVHAIRAGNHMYTRAENLAKERDFYKLRELTKQDVDYIRWLKGKPITDEAGQIEDNFISMFTAPFVLRNMILSRFGKFPEEANAVFEEVVNNLEEEWHTAVEAGAVHILEMLKNGDVKFFDIGEKDCMDFINYVHTQYLRTKSMKDRIVATMVETAKQLPGFDTEKTWGIFRHILAFRAGLDMYRNRKSHKLVVLNNGTNKPLITGDQPIINLEATPGKPPSRFELYYPVSPCRAVILTDNPQAYPDSLELNDERLDWYNSLMYRARHEFAFSNSKESLQEVVDANPLAEG